MCGSLRAYLSKSAFNPMKLADQLPAVHATFSVYGRTQVARLQPDRSPSSRSSYAGNAASFPRICGAQEGFEEAQGTGQEALCTEIRQQSACKEVAKSLVDLVRRETFYVRPLRKVLSWASIRSGVNRLDSKRRQQVVAALVEGCSIRATCRMTGVAKGTVLRLVAELGEACDEYQDRALRDLPSKRVQCDEIWSFCYAKEKNVPERMKDMPGVGSIWTWTAIDADSKLAITWFVGDRSEKSAMKFMLDVASRMEGRIQLTTDGWKSYRYATTLAFDGHVDYAQLVKIYAGMPHDDGGKYSQPECIGTKIDVRHGYPDPDHVSTSYVERANLTMRMGMRRFTRLTNGFSKKIENHEHAIALHFMHYNFCRKHESLKMTPAMAAGVADHIWTLAELIALLPDQPAAAWGSRKKAKTSADEPNSK